MTLVYKPSLWQKKDFAMLNHVAFSPPKISKLQNFRLKSNQTYVNQDNICKCKSITNRSVGNMINETYANCYFRLYCRDFSQ